jgi:DNA polymerase/3'-5' exonuclease PolX
MRKHACIASAVALLLAGLLLPACGQGRKQEQVEPHSIDGVMHQLLQHVNLLEEAAQRQDFKYVHDFAYYIKSLAQALYSNLDDAQKEQAEGPLVELLEVANRLDVTSGRRQEEATLAGTRRLQEIVKELDAQLRPGAMQVSGAPGSG